MAIDYSECKTTVEEAIRQSAATAKTLKVFPILEASDVERLAAAINNLGIIVDRLLDEFAPKKKKKNGSV